MIACEILSCWLVWVISYSLLVEARRSEGNRPTLFSECDAQRKTRSRDAKQYSVAFLSIFNMPLCLRRHEHDPRRVSYICVNKLLVGYI